MPDHRPANVRLVSDSDATGVVREIFDDIKRTKGLTAIPNFWRALATNPDNLEMIWKRVKALMHPELVGRTSSLTPLMRELIAVAVSVTNNCAY